MTAPDWRETERRDPQFDGIEDWPTADILQALAGGQKRAIDALQEAIAPLSQAVEAAAARLRSGKGRLIYTGAGTSGRLAVLDGVELTPTFGWPAERCIFLLAGGPKGLHQAVEGAEDDTKAALADATNAEITQNDVVIGLAASGTTPYTRKIIAIARKKGALTIGMVNNPDAPLLTEAEIGILLRTGREVLAGSTRMGAGTSQKAALNLFSTALMAKLHKIHRGLMVDVLATNEKLVERAILMVMDLTGTTRETASDALISADNHVKTAILIVEGCSPEEAAIHLAEHNGHLTRALASLK